MLEISIQKKLRDYALEIELTVPGGVTVLFGRSGAGKSMTLACVAGLATPESGRIVVNGTTFYDRQAGINLRPQQRRVGYVTQDYLLFPHMTVWQNVAFGLKQHSRQEQERIVGEALEWLELGSLARQRPRRLSGGQQQRVALARALAPQPDLILLDEPFSNLDAGLRVRVRAEVRAILKQAGATAIFVTHDQEEALSLVDEVAVMLAGRVHQLASPQKLYRQPISREVATFIGDANFVPGFGYGRHIESLLGNLESQVPVEGPVDVLIRPENVEISPAPSEINAHRVRQQLFFGHDQLVSVQLSSGETIDVRLGPAYTFAVNQPVTVRVRGPVMAYRINETQRVG